MADPICSCCRLPARPRKILDSLLTAGISARDCAGFLEWWGAQDEEAGGKSPWKVSKSAVDRHKQNGHISIEHRVRGIIVSDETPTVRQMTDDLFRVWRSSKGKDYVPSDREMREWLRLAKDMDAMEKRRGDDERLAKLIAGAAPPPSPETAGDSEDPNDGHTQVHIGEGGLSGHDDRPTDELE